MVQVRFVGSGDAFGSGGRLQACILVDGASDRILLDCGATSLVGLKRAHIPPESIGWVLLSHLHGDHFAGVPFLVLDGQFSRRTLPLRVVGPPGVRERIEGTMEALFPGSAAVKRAFDIEYHEWTDGGAISIGSASAMAFPVDHSSGATPFAIRLSVGGRCIAYSGDTAWCPSLIEAAKDSDLFIAEAYYYEKSVRYHLDYRTLMSHRESLKSRRIVLTHMSADMLDRLEQLELETAHDGLAIDLNDRS